MSTQMVEQQPHAGGTEREKEKKSIELAGAGATTEAVGAAAAIVLAILGLTGALSVAMMAIATIVLGAAILLDAAAIGARYRHLVTDVHAGERENVRTDVGGGISAGSIAGIAGIVLGILALLGMAPVALCTVALIVFGAALLLASAAKSRFASLTTAHYGVGETTRRVLDEAVSLSSGGEVLVGIAAIVLGILALLGVQPVTLVLVGLLGVGVAVLMSGSALGARMLSMLRHAH